MKNKDFLIVKFALLGAFYNLLLSWLPPAPLLCFLGSGLTARKLLKEFAQKGLKIAKSDKLLFQIITSVSSGAIVGYVFLLTFIIILKTPLPDDWFKFETLEKLVQSSSIFKIQIYLIAFVLSLGSSLLGSIVAFKTGRGETKITEEEFLNKLSSQELSNYVD